MDPGNDRENYLEVDCFLLQYWRLRCNDFFVNKKEVTFAEDNDIRAIPSSEETEKGAHGQ